MSHGGEGGEISRNPAWLGYRCTICDRGFPTNWGGFVCDRCGPDGILDVLHDYAAIAARLERRTPFPPQSSFRIDRSVEDAVVGAESPQSFQSGGRLDLWRFAALLPVLPRHSHPAWSIGNTPLHVPARLREALGLPRLWLKDDTGLPSASLKDRAAAVGLAHAAMLGVEHVACASTGNAAASLAVLGARLGIASTIFVPASAPPAKLAQLALHGAEVVRVKGSYDRAYEQSLRVIAERGWYSRNCAHNALLVEGKKTAALEIAADLGWQAPDAVFVPVGDGCIISSVGKAFAELERLGITSARPRLYGIQAEGAAPLVAAWLKVAVEAGVAPERPLTPETADQTAAAAATLCGRAILSRVQPVEARTIADSIAVGTPRNRVKAWKQVAASGGAFLAVPDARIVEAIGLQARLAGVWAEPSAAAALAGLIAARDAGLVRPDERIVVLVTGHGLKDPTPLS